VNSYPVPIICIGGAVLDRNLTCTDGYTAGASNPVRSASGFGGVARNVAESLGRLGAQVTLVSAVGNDAAGARLTAALKDARVGTDGLATIAGHSTAEYLAAMNKGEMVAAFADMEIFDQLTPDRVAPALANLPPTGIVFADCNLPAETITMLCERARLQQYLLAIDGVSPAKIKRLPKKLGDIGVLFTNAAQVTELTRQSSGHKGVERMLKRGIRNMVATMGRHGLILAEDAKITVMDAPNVPIVSVSGAGDAVAAGTLFGLSRGQMMVDSVMCGVALAALVLQSVHTVPPQLSLDVLAASLDPVKKPRKGATRVH
jgi:pseudouridine kinase